MPVGPRGEKRPSNPNAMSTMVARIATGRAEEQYADESRDKPEIEGRVAAPKIKRAKEKAASKS